MPVAVIVSPLFDGLGNLLPQYFIENLGEDWN
jgi:hypothetical protein